MMIKLLINKRLVAIVSTYVQVKGLAEDVKDNSYEDLISHVSKLEKMSWSYLVVTAS